MSSLRNKIIQIEEIDSTGAILNKQGFVIAIPSKEQYYRDLLASLQQANTLAKKKQRKDREIVGDKNRKAYTKIITPSAVSKKVSKGMLTTKINGRYAAFILYPRPSPNMLAECIKCGATEKLTIDHIHERQDGGIDEDNNKQVLCCDCHYDKTAFFYNSRITLKLRHLTMALSLIKNKEFLEIKT
ncbi:MAG: HNH endonuclease [Gammaproteobacteria bacterium]